MPIVSSINHECKGRKIAFVNDYAAFLPNYLIRRRTWERGRVIRKLSSYPAVPQTWRKKPTQGKCEKSASSGYLAKQPCNGAIFSPSGWETKPNATKAPDHKLTLEYIYGYRSWDCRQNLHYTAGNQVIYPAAACGVVLDPETQKQKFFQGHTDDILCMALHPKGDIVATAQAGLSPMICIWKASTCEKLAELKGYHQSAITAVAFDSTGAYVTSIGRDESNSLAVHDWQSGKLVADVKLGKRRMFTVKFNPEDGRIVVGGHKFLKWFTIRNGLAGQDAAYNGKGGGCTVLAIAFQPDGSTLTATKSGDIYKWGNTTKNFFVCQKRFSLVHHGAIHDLQYFEDDKSAFFVSGGKDGKLKLHNPFMTKLMGTVDLGKLLGAALDKDGQPLIDSDGTAPCIRAVTLNSKSKKLVVGTKSSIIVEVDISDMRAPSSSCSVLMQSHAGALAKSTATGPREVCGLASHPHRNIFYSAGDDHTLRCWDVKSCKQLAVRRYKQPLRAIAVHPSGEQLAIGDAAGNITVIELNNGRQIAEFQGSHTQVNVMKYSPTGKMLAVAGGNCIIAVFEVVRNFKLAGTCHGHTANVAHLDWSEDSKILQSNSVENELCFWEMPHGTQIATPQQVADTDWATYTCPASWGCQGIWPKESAATDLRACARSNQGSWREDESITVTADNFGQVKLSRYPSDVGCAEGRTYVAHSTQVSNCTFSFHESHVFTTGGMDNCVMQWRHYRPDEADEDEDEDEDRVQKYERVNKKAKSLVPIGQRQGYAQYAPMARDRPDTYVNHSIQELGGKRGLRTPLQGKPCLTQTSMPAGFKPGGNTYDVAAENLDLQWAMGYRGFDTLQNIFLTDAGKLVYHVAAVGVVLDMAQGVQSLITASASSDEEVPCGNTDDIVCMAMHPNKRFVATGEVGHAPKIVIWDASSTPPTCLNVVSGFHQRAVIALSFSPDGKYLASVGLDDDHSLAIYDWTTEELLAHSRGDKNPIHHITWSKFNGQLITTGKKHVKFWGELGQSGPITKGTRLAPHSGVMGGKGKLQTFYSSAVLAADTLAVGTKDGCVYVFMKNRLSFATPAHKGAVTSICLADDGCLVTGGTDAKVKVWKYSNSKLTALSEHGVPSRNLPGRTSVVRTVLAPSKSLIYLGTKGGEIYCLNGSSCTLVTQGHGEGEVNGLAVHPSQRIVATAGGDGTVRLWDMAKRAQLTICEPSSSAPTVGAPDVFRKKGAQSVSFHPKGDTLAVGMACGKVVILGAPGMKPVTEIVMRKEAISVVKFSPDGKFLAVGSHENVVDIYEAERSYKRCGICKGHSSYITFLDWSSDSKWVVSSSADYEILHWLADSSRATSRAAVKDLDWASHTSVLGWPVLGIFPCDSDGTDVNTVDRSPSRLALVSGDDCGRVNLFKYPALGGKPKVYGGHSSHVTCVSFSTPGDEVYSTGGHDGMVAVWKVQGAKVVQPVKSGAPSAQWYQEFSAGADNPDLGPVAIGVLRLDYHYPPLGGDIDSQDSYGYQVVFKQVDGLTFEMAQAGKMSKVVEKNMKGAIKVLEEKDVVGITGDCGFMMAYQVFVRQQTDLPVFMSSMMQAPMLIAAFEKEAKFAILTANSKSLEPNLEMLLEECGMHVDSDRFVVVGLQDVPGFDAVANGEAVDPKVVQPGIVRVMRSLCKKLLTLEGIILECTELPAYADAIRAETGLPVFDAITLVDFFHSAVSDNPRYGTNTKGHAKGKMKAHKKSNKKKGTVKGTHKKRFKDGADHPDLGPVAVGVLRLEYHYPPLPGDIDHPDSFGYKVLFKQVDGLTFEMAQSGKMTPAVAKNMDASIAWLEKRDVVGITGDCGFMMAFQVYVRQRANCPVFMSSMLQCSMLTAAFDKESVFAILTANSESLAPNIPWLLTECGVQADVNRYIIVGLQDVPGFDAVAAGEAVDPYIVQPGIVKVVNELQDQVADLAAIILECTELPHYADALRAETGLPVFDAITMVDYFHSSCADNPNFGCSYQQQEQGHLKWQQEFAEGADNPDLGPVAIGVLRLDYHYPPLGGDIDSQDSYGYQVVFKQVDGLTFEMAQAGKMSKVVEKNMKGAIQFLEKKDVVGITGDCGFMMAYQVFVRQQTDLPVFMSSMMQAPMLIAAFEKEAKFAILTANSKSLEPNLEMLLEECGMHVDSDRFVVVGLQDVPGFDAVANGEAVDPKVVQPGIVKMVQDVCKKILTLEGIILECTELPAYADAIRAETGLPVFDAITLVDFFHSAVSDNPRYGTNTKGHAKGKMKAHKKSNKKKGTVKGTHKKRFKDGADHPDLGPVAVGVLRLEYHYPPLPGDIDHPDSFGYKVLFKQVDGLTFEMAQSGKMTPAVAKNMDASIAWLEKRDVVGITGDCGFMMAFQVYVRQRANCPVFMSSMLQCSMLTAAFDKESVFAIFTANSKSLQPNIKWLLTECGVDVPVRRFRIIGLQDVPGFDAVAAGEAVDPYIVQPGIIKVVTDLQDDEPELAAVILECTELPHYADAIRAETGLPVFDAITMVDYFHSSCADNPNFGCSYQQQEQGHLKWQQEFAEGADNPDLGPVAIGVLRLDYHYPPLGGDIDSQDSYGYQVVFKQVDGLTFEMAQAGKMSKTVEKNMKGAIQFLEEKDVVGITGDCGFMMAYQVFVRQQTDLPVFMSSMMQAPMLIAAFEKEAKFAILTANSKSLEPNLEMLLEECGMHVDSDRFVVVGLQDVPGFDAVANGEAVDPKVVQPGIVKMVQDVCKKILTLEGIILECTELPAYADAIRAETGLPVFDAITLVDFFHSAVSDNPRYGTNTKGHAKGKMKAHKKSNKKKGTVKGTHKKRFKDGADHPDLGPVAVGVLRLEYHYPPLPGDIDHPDSFGYKVLFKQVDGLTFEMAQSGKMTPAVAKNMDASIAWLEKRDVVGITGDCGFMMAFQVYVRQRANCPVFMSSMLQCSMLTAAFDKESVFAIFTANSKSLQPNIKWLLTECGVDVPVRRFRIIGLQDVPGFDAVAAGEAVDPYIVQPGIIKVVTDLQDDEPELAAVILECTELPHYADAIRAETGLPVFDAITMVDYFHSSCADNPNFGCSYQQQEQGHLKWQQEFAEGADNPDLGPVGMLAGGVACKEHCMGRGCADFAIGVLRLDYHYPPLGGDIDSQDSYGYQVVFKQVDGLTFEMAQAGKMSKTVEKNMKGAIQFLEEKDVVGITGDCGFMMAYQVFVRQQTDLPVFMSSMMQAPMLIAAFEKEAKFAILTANSKSLEPNLEMLLEECGMHVDSDRFVVVGLQDVPGFDAVANGEAVDPKVVQPGIVKMVQDVCKKILTLEGIILECTELPAYADAIRAETGLPVFDAITLVDFFHSAVSDNPRYGTNTKGHAKGKMKAHKKSNKKKGTVKGTHKKRFKDGADHPDLGPVAVGVLRLEYHYPPLPGDIDHPDSFGYKVLFKQVDGLTFEMAQSGKMTPAVAKNMDASIAWLEKRDVVGITGDCGFMMAFQVYVRQRANCPVFMSSMLQCSMLTAAFDKESVFAIFTANSKSLQPNIKWLLTECGVDVPVRRFRIIGLQDVPGFDAVAAGEAVDPYIVQPGIIKVVTDLQDDEPELAAVILECTELPHYADAIRAETGLPVFDAITMVDYFHSSCADNPNFGCSYQQQEQGHLKWQQEFAEGADNPDLGPVGMLAGGMAWHAESIAWDGVVLILMSPHVVFKQVDGLTFEMAQAGKMSKTVEKNMKGAIQFLEEKDVVGITGDCGFMMAYQVFVRQQTDLPVFMSSMMQAPMLIAAFEKEAKFAILTANSKSLEPNLEMLLEECGMHVDSDRFVVVGLQDVPGFDAVANGEAVDPKVVQPGIVKMVQDVCKKILTLEGIILECTELPAYADAIRAETGLPVFDAITLVDFFHSAVSDNPRYGTNTKGHAKGKMNAHKKSNKKKGTVKGTHKKRFKDGADHPDLGPVAVGVLRLEYHYPPLPGDIDHPDSFGYKVLFKQVDGLTFEMAQSGKMTPAVAKNMDASIAWLEKRDVVGITGDCGFMMAFQVYVRQRANCPVFMSSMLQCSMLTAAFDKESVFAIFTANSKSLQPNIKWLLTECGVDVPVRRFRIIGLQDVPGFDAVAAGEAVDPYIVQPGIIKVVTDLQDDEPELAAVILECTELPHYADAIRAETGLPVFDAITMVDYFHSSCADNPNFGCSYQQQEQGHLKWQQEFAEGADNPDLGPVAIGVLRLDYHYPPLGGDIDSQDSYGYQVVFKQVDGLTFEMAQAGKMSKTVEKNMKGAIQFLEEKDVVGITGDCGFMMAYQVFVRQQTDLPVFMSSMMQAPMLIAAFEKEAKFAILTANSKSLEPNLEMLLEECGMHVDSDRFVVVGLQDVPGFDAVANGEAVDPKVVQPGIVKMVQDVCKKILTLEGIILECTELPAYADAIRAETGLPVFDAITLVDFFHSAVSDNPRYGTNTKGHAKGKMKAHKKSNKKKGTVKGTHKKRFKDGADHPDLGPVAVGVLRLEYHYPPLPGDIDHPDSFGYKVLFKQVDGLTFEMAQSGKMTPAVAKNMDASIAWLEKRDVVGITGDCGFMMAFQVYVRQRANCPVFMSSMLQCSMLTAAFDKESVFAIFTANSKSLQPNIKWLLTECGVDVPVRRFRIIGLQDVPGFDAVAAGEAVDPYIVQPGIIKVVTDLQDDEPELAAVILECTELPHYADAIRAETGLPVFDAITMVDYFHSSCADNPNFGCSYQQQEQGHLKWQQEFAEGADNPDLGPVAIGVLRLDYHYPPLGGDIDSQDSYGYQVVFKQVDGLTFEMAQSGRMTKAVEKNMKGAIQFLEEKDVVGITGDCGFMMAYQVFVRQQTDLPVFMSSMIQAPMLVASNDSEAKFAILTANSKSLAPSLDWLLSECGVTVDVDRFVVVGLQDVPGFDAVAKGEAVDPKVVQPGIIDMLRETQKDEPQIAGIILECTELPAYADAIREKTGLPVFDAITCVDFFHAACADNPNFGTNIKKKGKLAGKPKPGGGKAKKRTRKNKFREGADNPNLGPIAVGVLRLEYHYPPLAGDIDSEDSFGYKVFFRQVDGLTFELAQRGRMNKVVEKNMVDAITWLEAKQVVGITGDCGFMMAYQVFVRQHTDLPVFMSSLLQAPILVAAHDREAVFALVTANSDSLEANIDTLLEDVGMDVDADRFKIVGLQDVPGFDAVAKGEAVDPLVVQPGIIARLTQLADDEPDLQAVLLECTELPHYADAIRAELGLPVFDVITLTDFFHSSRADNANFGQSFQPRIDNDDRTLMTMD
ncbi:hypothetical protein CYMTET_54067 [Cymbomonas tetramitiformis]|uniref:Uncharacterized protein n=1 Tax=Cymbomonas tetramitiformis TaxID=36881 RepID=A0AAE0BGX0_9CHLO|nr:hypothetical protein CYMTET_54067 [Cymbomonas tetramitiformis]